MPKYSLKKGKVLTPYGAMCPITDKNLTDELAEHLIKKGKVKESEFEIEKTKPKTK